MRVARDNPDELRRISVDVDRSMCGAKPTQVYVKVRFFPSIVSLFSARDTPPKSDASALLDHLDAHALIYTNDVQTYCIIALCITPLENHVDMRVYALLHSPPSLSFP